MEFLGLRITPHQGHRGQSLVELALTLPFIIILLFGMVEFSRAWQAWHGAKQAADDGCYTAALYKRTELGESVMRSRAEQAHLTVANALVSAQMNRYDSVPIGYECSITVQHFPLWAGLGMNIPGYGQLTLFQGGIPITYNQDYFRGVF